MANTGAGGDLGQIVEHIRGILATTPLPPGYTTSLDGTFQAQEAAARMITKMACNVGPVSPLIAACAIRFPKVSRGPLMSIAGLVSSRMT